MRNIYYVRSEKAKEK